MTPIRHSFVLSALYLLLAWFPGEPVHAQPGSSSEEFSVVANKEYIFQQQPGEILVVRVSAFEAWFVSRVSTEVGGNLGVSGLQDARMLPVFQYIPASDDSRQIDIDVDAMQVTSRTDFHLQLTRLNVRDDRTGAIATAYRTLSTGLMALPNGSVPQWTVKIQTLFSAASQFEAIGMEEMRLWCRTYGTHLVLNQLQDYQTALDWSNELLSQPRISRYPDLEFIAKKLKSSAMAQGRIGIGGGDPVNSSFQIALAETVTAAKNLGYRYEESLALMSGGVDLIDNGLHRQAQGFLGTALEIAVNIEANDLAASIREHMVEAYSQVGELDATGGILEDIESHLVDEGDQQELALNLIQQGQVHNDGHRYTQAIDVLARAVSLEQGELSRLEAELELGMALSATGRASEALTYLNSAVTNSRTGKFRRPSGVLKIRTALYEIAAIHRHLQEWEQLSQIRAEQRESLNSPARQASFSYHRATDALFRYGPTSSTTWERYNTAFRQADGADQEELRSLTRLGLCALRATSPGQEMRCEPGELRIAFQRLQSTQVQHRRAEATLFYTRILNQTGRGQQALEISEELIDSLISTGYSQLGAWYWQWREMLTGDLVRMAIRAERANGGGASTSLLALIKVRALERGGAKNQRPFTSGSLQILLEKIPADAIVLSYFVTDSASFAWVGRRNGVKRIEISSGARIESLSREFRQALSTDTPGSYDSIARQLGSALLDPVADELETSIYLIDQAPLLGIPIDALVLDGEPLVLRHSINHLELLGTESLDSKTAEFNPPSSVFLAGDPQDWSGEFARRLEISEEVQAVNERFVGPGLHTVQGVSLLGDEFQDPRYRESELVHLAVPGIVDLSPGYASALYLSEPTRGEGREQLDSATLASFPIKAGLAFLSRTQFLGSGSALENHKGVVSAVLDAGAGSVIASLWPVDPKFRMQFVEDFYSRLLVEKNIATALSQAKRNSMANGESRDWASFQLFLN